MSKRKYEEYVVKVTYKNGDSEQMQFNGINTSSYKDMLEVYREVKENKSKDVNVSTIDFIGISKDGELKVFFTKAINVKLNTKEELNKDCRVVVSEILDKVELLKQQKDYHKMMINKYEKQIDTMIHSIESHHNNIFKSDDVKNNFKIRTFDKIEELSELRRYSKDQIADLDNIMKGIRDAGIHGLKPFTNQRKKYKMNSIEFIKSVEKEVIYQDENEKSAYLYKYQDKYDKYIDDEAHNKLYFYNNVGLGKLNDRNKQKKLNKKLQKNSGRIA